MDNSRFPPSHRGRSEASMWSIEDFLRWLGLETIGLAMLLAGWIIASGQGRYDDQIGAGTLAVGGLLVAGIGHVLWVTGGRRGVGIRTRLLRDEPWLPRVAGLQAQLPDAEDSFVADPRLTFFHRRQCPMAAGRGWIPQSRQEHYSAGRVPCGVCRP
jgi:hypothetical protein